MALHQWLFDAGLPGHEVDARWADRILRPGVAYVMGRNMFGPVRGTWASYDGGSWRGWWGEDPPYHAPVFVLTHHEHAPIEMDGRHHLPLRHRWVRRRTRAGSRCRRR